MNAVTTDEKKPPEVVAQNIIDADEHRLLISGLSADLSQAGELCDLYHRYGGMLIRWHRGDRQHPAYLIVSKHRAELGQLLAQMKPPVFL